MPAMGSRTARRLSLPSEIRSSEFLVWNRSPGSSTNAASPSFVIVLRRRQVQCRSTSTSIAPLLMAATTHPMMSCPNASSLEPAANGGDAASTTPSTSSSALCLAWSRRQRLTMAAARAGGRPWIKSRSSTWESSERNNARTR